MAEAKYTCTQCQATLKLKNEVPPGKKIKCPKCEAVFVPNAEAAKPAAAPAKASWQDDDGGGVFGFKSDGSAKGAAEEPKSVTEEVQDRLRKRFPRRKRSTAQAIVTKPSNQMLATACTACLSSALSMLVALWPMLFSLKTELSADDLAWNWLIAGACLVSLLYFAGVVFGAVKFQSLESVTYATIASLMLIAPTSWALGIPAFHWFTAFVRSLAGDLFMYITWAVVSLWFFYVGSINLKTLRNPDVLEAFGTSPDE